MNRLTENDRNLGPFTLGRWKKTFSAEFSTGDEEDGPMRNQFLFVAFGWALRIKLPNLVQCAREKVVPAWDSETVKRLGRDYYFKTWDRRFGVTLSDMGCGPGGNGYDFLQIKYGRSTHDSSTDKSWCKHLPWKQWNHVRHSFYAPDGSHFYTEPKRVKGRGMEHFEAWMKKQEECPVVHFGFEDYDGELIVATCRIEEREWQKGEGWFKWLKWFSCPLIHRTLNLHFSAEVGTEKGSWKGGIIGTSREMKPGDTPESAFRRYCEKEHERKGRKYHIRFIGPCDAPPKKERAQIPAATSAEVDCKNCAGR